MGQLPFQRSASILVFFVIFISFFNTQRCFAQRSGVRTIVIDAGHGGQDGTTRGIISKEKDVALKIALLLGKAIEENMESVKVLYTRKTDVFVPLYERIGLANKAKASLFISIHCNSMPMNKANRKSVRGVETFVAGFNRLGEQDAVVRENASILLEKDYKKNYEGFDPKDPESAIIFSLLKNAFRDQSIKFATLVQAQYTAAGRIDRGVKEDGLAVLQRAGMPAVLTEIGFISSPEEEKYMNSESGQNEIVSCLLKAIQVFK